MDMAGYVAAAVFDLALPALGSILLGVAVWAVKRLGDSIGVDIDRHILDGIEQYAGNAIGSALDRAGRKINELGPGDADLPAIVVDATDWLEQHVPKWAQRAGLSRDDLRSMVESRLP